MKPWPHHGLYGGHLEPDGKVLFSVDSQHVAYERARADKWEEVARAAEQGLLTIAQTPNHTDKLTAEHMRGVAMGILMAIGPLPEAGKV